MFMAVFVFSSFSVPLCCPLCPGVQVSIFLCFQFVFVSAFLFLIAFFSIFEVLFVNNCVARCLLSVLSMYTCDQVSRSPSFYVFSYFGSCICQ